MIVSTAQRGLSAGNVLNRPVSNPFTITQYGSTVYIGIAMVYYH